MTQLEMIQNPAIMAEMMADADAFKKEIDRKNLSLPEILILMKKRSAKFRKKHGIIID